MKTFIFRLIGIGLIFTYGCTSKDAFKNTRKIENILYNLVEEKQTCGIAVAIKVDTFISSSNQYGYADIDNKISVAKNAQFRIASITKPITATAILQLVQANKIRLEDTINEFFPDFPHGEKITIYHLLTHTSGITNWYEGGMPSDEPENFPMCKNPHFYLGRMEELFLFEPGSAWSYSNSGYVLLGEIIELISQMSYEKYLRKNIFEIVGMRHTELEYIEQPRKDWVKGHKNIDNKFMQPEIYHMPFSAGGLRSTIGDLMLFLNALESGKLLDKEMFVTMTSYAKLNNGKPVYEGLYTSNGKPIRFPNNIRNYGYGMGFQLMENFGEKVITHSGDIAGFHSVLMMIPHNSVKMIILANTENGIMPQLESIEKLAVSIEH